jgi:hypothetical protein
VRVDDVANGVTVELVPVGYQELQLDPQDVDEPDTWLDILGTVTTLEASWSFTQPCLDTDEAAELLGWLRDVAAGKVEPSEEAFSRAGAVLLFTEPNVSVSLVAREPELLKLVWSFKYESAPPGATDDMKYGLRHRGYPVRTAISPTRLAQAAEVWALELARFPDRRGRPPQP